MPTALHLRRDFVRSLHLLKAFMSQKISPTLDQAKSALSNVQNLIQDLLAQRSTLQSRRQAVFDERESLFLQPLSKAEILQGVSEIIGQRAEGYRSSVKRVDLFDLLAYPAERGHGEYPRPERHEYPLTICDLDQIAFKPTLYARERQTIAKYPHIKDHGFHLPIIPRHGEFETTWLFFFFGDLIKQRLCALLADGEEGVLLENGQPNAQSLFDRRKKIDDLSQELQEIDQQIQSLNQDIDSLTAPVIRSAQALNEN